MSVSGSAPARQPAPELPERELPDIIGPEEVPQGNVFSVDRLRLLWENRRILFRAALYAFLASTLVAFFIPVRYESTARLMPPDNQSASGLATAVAAMSGNAGGLAGIAGDVLGLKSTSDVFVGILSSRTVQDKLIQQFDLKKLYRDRRMEDARKDLTSHTSISVDRKSQIITIGVTDHDPKRAAAMGQAYIEELNRLVAELSTSSARRERIFLEERLQAVSKDLESAEKEFSQFSSKNSAIDIKEQGKAMVEAAATLQGQLIAAESELQALRQIYTDNNVRVRSVGARIAELKHQLEKIGGKGEDLPAKPGQQETTSAEQQDSLYPSIRKLPLLGVTYADLYRTTRVQEAVFETLTKEYELAKVQEAKEIPTVKVLDPPNVPDKKSFPPRAVIAVLGTLLGLALAMTCVWGRTRWDDADAADPRKQFATEVFTTVRMSLPKFSRNGARAKENGHRPWGRFRKPENYAKEHKQSEE
jgi:uncharacterized protein involved in exopolysaccharide biosynthesis